MANNSSSCFSRSKLRIGLVQRSCSNSVDHNIEDAIGGIREAAKQGANIISLQELFNSTYFCTTEEHSWFDLAEPIPGPTVVRLTAVARELGVVLIVPLFERRAAGVYHNSAAVIDADGVVKGVYRKMHIPDDPLYFEKFYFTPGDAGSESPGTGGGFMVFETRFAKIGVLICWDQWYPEGARITSLMGADVLFFPTAIGWHPKEKAEFGKKQVEAWQTVQRSHAIANGVFVAAVNRVGLESTPGTDGIEFFGRSFVCDPFGEILVEGCSDRPQVLVAECDLSLVEETRRHWPFLRDRRIDAYGPILKRFA